MNCQYCGTEKQSGKICDKCGAPLPERNSDFDKSEPFFYNGYICYTLRDFGSDVIEVQFWLGRDLIERIAVSRDVVKFHVPEFESFMPFFWDLFLVAHGEKEVLEYQEKNKKYPARFEVRRIENPELEALRTMDLRELLRHEMEKVC
jgi:hypothetical protein